MGSILWIAAILSLVPCVMWLVMGLGRMKMNSAVKQIRIKGELEARSSSYEYPMLPMRQKNGISTSHASL